MPKVLRVFWGGREKNETNTRPGSRWAPGEIRCKGGSEVDTGPLPWSTSRLCTIPLQTPLHPQRQPKGRVTNEFCVHMSERHGCATWLCNTSGARTSNRRHVSLTQAREDHSLIRTLPTLSENPDHLQSQRPCVTHRTVFLGRPLAYGRHSLPQVSHDRRAHASHKDAGTRPSDGA